MQTLKTMPVRPVVGYRQLSEILHRTPKALSVAMSKGRLPLAVFRVGHTVIFDLGQVREFAAAYRPVRGPSRKGSDHV